MNSIVAIILVILLLLQFYKDKNTSLKYASFIHIITQSALLIAAINLYIVPLPLILAISVMIFMPFYILYTIDIKTSVLPSLNNIAPVLSNLVFQFIYMLLISEMPS